MMHIDNFIYSKKAQVGDTMTWIVAFTMIFFIMIIFVAAVSLIFAGGNRGPDTSVGKTIYLDSVRAGGLIDFINKNNDYLSRWADDEQVDYTEEKTYEKSLCEGMMKYINESQPEVYGIWLETITNGKIESINFVNSIDSCRRVTAGFSTLLQERPKEVSDKYDTGAIKIVSYGGKPINIYIWREKE